MLPSLLFFPNSHSRYCQTICLCDYIRIICITSASWNELALIRCSSANQSAIISSRLTNFLKRPWTALAPCPMGKELVGTHPKRLYFFLATRPRQAIPDPDAPQNKRLSAAQMRKLTPSLTSGTSEDEERSLPPLTRRERSVSVEVDLYTTEIDDTNEHLSRSTSFSLSDGSSTSAYTQAQTSTPLDKDELVFTRKAEELQRRAEAKNSKVPDSVLMFNGPLPEPAITFYDFEDNSFSRNLDFSSTTLGQSENSLMVMKNGDMLSSPMMYAHTEMDNTKQAILPLSLSIEHPKMDTSFGWTDILGHPETVELDELDDLFASY